MSSEPNDNLKEDRHERAMAFWLAMTSTGLAAGICAALIFKGIPDENEVLFGTVVGFVFGNMVGPVFRKIFGGMDPEARKSAMAQNQNLKQAMETIAAAPPAGAPMPVVVENKPEEPVPVAATSAAPAAPEKEEAVY